MQESTASLKKECPLSYRNANRHTAMEVEMDFGFVFSIAARSVLALARCMCASLATGPSVVCSSTGSDQVQRHQTSSGFIVTTVITLPSPPNPHPYPTLPLPVPNPRPLPPPPPHTQKRSDGQLPRVLFSLYTYRDAYNGWERHPFPA